MLNRRLNRTRTVRGAPVLLWAGMISAYLAPAQASGYNNLLGEILASGWESLDACRFGHARLGP